MSSSSTSTCAWSTSARCRPAPRWRCASSPIPIWWWRWRRSRSSTDRSLAQANRVAQEPAEARATASPGYAVPLDGPETLHEATDRHLPLHAGQPHARAGVDADAEGQVPVGVPTDVEPVRIGELGRIAVGRSDADVHVGTGGHLDAVQHRVSCGSAVAELVRALEAEKLLHGGADEVRVRTQGGQRASGLRSSRSTALPIRLVVVSCPALSRKMQLCSNSSSLSRSSVELPAPSALPAVNLERISPSSWLGSRPRRAMRSRR